MTNPTNNNGDQPVTQVTRDQMAQTDHDQLVRVTVMLQTLLDSQGRVEQQIKDLNNNQQASFTAWDAKSEAAHIAFDLRLRKMEDLATVYVPKAQAFELSINQLQTAVQKFKDDSNRFLGGWKAVVLLIGGVGGIISFLFMITQISCALTCHVK